MDSFSTGKKETFRLKTKLGYELECTEEHQIYTPRGYVKLKDLCVGDKIYVNGQKIIEPLYKNYDWLYHQYITLNKTYKEISEEFGIKINLLKSWKIRLNLPNKGSGYRNIGRKPWNKGLNESQDIRVKNQADALRKYRYNRWEDTSNIKKVDTIAYQKYNKGFCEICKTTKNLDVHHIDEDRSNNFPSNLITLCKTCHSRLHSKNLLYVYADEITLVEKVGIQDVYDVEMNGKYHNFNANGIIVHNCNYSKNKHNGELKFLAPVEIDPHSPEYEMWLNSMQITERNYLDMAKYHATPDQLSLILPQSTAAEFNITGNLRAWRQLFDLRVLDKTGHARPCIHEILEPTLELFHKEIPIIFDDQYQTLVENRKKKLANKNQYKLFFDGKQR